MKLILAGGSVFDPSTNAEAMYRMAIQLGVDHKDLMLEKTTKDTEEEAVAVSKILKQAPFFLVTSAAHMPRSMMLFEKQKARPIAVPIDYSFRSVNPPFLLKFLPGLGALNQSERAIREYLGITYSKLRGKAT